MRVQVCPLGISATAEVTNATRERCIAEVLALLLLTSSLLH